MAFKVFERMTTAAGLNVAEAKKPPETSLDNAAGRKAEDDLVLGTQPVLPTVRGHERDAGSYLMGGKGRSAP